MIRQGHVSRRGDARTRKWDDGSSLAASPLPAPTYRARRIAASRGSGFTLIELMVVMVILVLLAGTVTMLVVKRAGQAKILRVKADMEQIGSALESYKLDNQDFPPTDAGLGALVSKPGDLATWNGPYLKGLKTLPKDPWGHEYNYKSPGDHNADGFDLWTLGRDGKEGGTDEDVDQNNWSEGENK